MKRSDVPRINNRRLRAFCEFARTQQFDPPLNFYSITLPDGKEVVQDRMYPPIDTPWAIDFFFLACAHQFGFWTGETHYERPLVGTVDGKQLKGSDLLWTLFRRGFERDSGGLSGQQLLNLTSSDWRRLMSDDNGPVPILSDDTRLDLTHRLARSLNAHKGRTGRELVQAATKSTVPARLLLDTLTHPEGGVAGYCEDPLRKKAMLLLMALANRPEHFLVPESSFVWHPVIDYHVMRVLLRARLVLLPATWREENIARAFTDPEREALIRRACFDCAVMMIAWSEREMSELDQLLWMARRYCPEMEEPRCGTCTLASVCGKDTALFQPVLRTEAY